MFGKGGDFLLNYIEMNTINSVSMLIKNEKNSI